jgi:hypothetical protein
MKLLDLPDGIRSTVYMVIVETLKNDRTLKAIVHPDGWRTYSDEDGNDAPPSSDTLPSIEILPYGAAARPASIVSQDAPMLMQLSVATAGLDVRDLLNLWEAVEAALWKGDGTSTLNQQLKTAVADLGRSGAGVATVTLMSPAITPAESGLNLQNMMATGTLSVVLRVPK